jgi:hypothetical protein
MFKNMLLFLLVAAIGTRLIAQTQPYCDLPPASYLFNSNHITAPIQNNGTFFNSTDTSAGFRVYLPSVDAETHTIRAAGLWIGGLDPAGNLFLATGGYHGDSSVTRFKPGKINFATQTPFPNSCEHFNKIWRVELDALRRHILDLRDNGVIDHPEPSLMAWPGRGNPHFEAYNGFPFPEIGALTAPFADENGDNIYDPLQGDTPGPYYFFLNFIKFDAITWCVYEAFPFEISQTAYAVSCENDFPLNNSVILDFAIMNKGYEPMDSLFAGIHTEFELGCPGDDYVGTALERNAYYAYNAIEPLDAELCHCSNPALCAHLPVQSVRFIDVNMDHSIAYGTTADGAYFPPPMSPDFNMYELYNLLNGRWKSGVPMFSAGNGFLTQGFPIDHIYTGRPGISGEWSMLAEALPAGTVNMLGSTKIGILEPFGISHLSVAFTAHHRLGLSDPWLGQYEVMLDEAHQVLDWLEYPSNACMRSILSGTDEADTSTVRAFPNPAGERLEIQFSDEVTDRKYALFDLSGKLLFSGAFQSGIRESLDVSNLLPGIYFMQIITANGRRSTLRWCKM